MLRSHLSWMLIDQVLAILADQYIGTRDGSDNQGAGYRGPLWLRFRICRATGQWMEMHEQCGWDRHERLIDPSSPPILSRLPRRHRSTDLAREQHRFVDIRASSSPSRAGPSTNTTSGQATPESHHRHPVHLRRRQYKTWRLPLRRRRFLFQRACTHQEHPAEPELLAGVASLSPSSFRLRTTTSPVTSPTARLSDDSMADDKPSVLIIGGLGTDLSLSGDLVPEPHSPGFREPFV